MVLLVHGLGVSHRTFAPLWRLLPGAQCPDLTGDDVPALVESLARVAPPRSVLVGNSLGAQVAIELAVRDPGRVAALVLVGPTGDPARRALLPQVLRLLACAAVEPPALVPLVVRDYARTGVPRLLRQARSMLATPVEAKLAVVEAPVVVLRGGRDPICGGAWAARLAARAPRGRLVVVPGAGHVLPWSHPEVVAAVVGELVSVLAGALE